MLKNPFKNFTFKERLFLILSLIIVGVSNLLSGDFNIITFLATLIGVTAVLLCAKGNVWGQILIAIFSVLYGIISLQYHYWGELATYMGMSFPMAIWSLYTWITHPSGEDENTVEIGRLTRKSLLELIASGILVTAAFYILLRKLNTPGIVFSTISITTSFFAAALTMLRSAYYGFWYALNDLTLIVLWTLASIEDSGYIPMVVNFAVFFANDMYGFYSWKKRKNMRGKYMTGIAIVDDIRTNWAIGDAKRDEGLTTPEDILRFDNISYGPYGEENLLDIYMQKKAEGLQPTIVNIHGGGWVYGSKEVYQFYCMSLAQQGFTVVNINYRLAPESRFPAAVEDINAALTFVAEHGKEYHIDKDRLVLVGDSAGGQLVSHYAAIATNPDFAKLFEFSVPDITIKALGLNCGAYNEKFMIQDQSDELFTLYTDCRGKKPEAELIDMVDTMKWITDKYPAAYVMSAECDFLLPAAKPMYDRITSFNVPAKLKIYGAKDRPDIGHVFHVNIKLPEAVECNMDEVEFFKLYV